MKLSDFILFWGVGISATIASAFILAYISNPLKPPFNHFIFITLLVSGTLICSYALGFDYKKVEVAL